MKYSRTDLSKAVIEVTLPSTNDLRIKETPDLNFIRAKKKKRKARAYANRIPKQYKTYISSHWWRERKARYYRKNGKKCAVCRSTKYIDLHHKIYGNYGKESDEDLIPLCGKHHLGLHAKHGVKGNMRNETEEYVHTALFDEEADRVMKAISQ